LKGEWIGLLRQGLGRSHLGLPVREDDIRFPYYGDALYDLVSHVPPQEAADVIVRGEGLDNEAKAFASAFIDEICRKAGITDTEIATAIGEHAVECGPLNWRWVRGALKVIDRRVPFGSGGSI